MLSRFPSAKRSEPVSPRSGVLTFRCNICGGANTIPLAELTREEGACSACKANVRSRAMIHLLSLRLFGRSLTVGEFPASAMGLKGIGMSDASMYSERLAARLAYTNTFFHKEPRLDIHKPDECLWGRNDFIVASDVLEHVSPPVSQAFFNLRRLLKKGGILVLSVPFRLDGRTIEHFPELHDYSIRKRGTNHVLLNRTADGRSQEFREL